MYKVLIAEEGRMIRKALIEIISRNEGFSVVDAVCCKEEILNACKSQKIDIVFMDAIFKGQSSIETGREIKKFDHDISLYIISSMRNDSHVKSFIKIGIEEYINMPMTFSKIGVALERYREKHNKYMDNPLLEDALEILEKKDYEGLYSCACRIIDRASEEDPERYDERILGIVRGIEHQLELVYGLNVDLAGKIPLEKAFVQQKIYWKLWLTEIMDHALQAAAVNQCEALYKVFDLIEMYLYAPVKLDRICRECNISEGHLNRKMRELMGTSTMDYLQRRKLIVAKKKLSFQTTALGDIAYELGYNESSYFSKVFKKYEGLAPISFRKNVRG